MELEYNIFCRLMTVISVLLWILILPLIIVPMLLEEASLRYTKKGKKLIWYKDTTTSTVVVYILLYLSLLTYRVTIYVIYGI